MDKKRGKGQNLEPLNVFINSGNISYVNVSCVASTGKRNRLENNVMDYRGTKIGN